MAGLSGTNWAILDVKTFVDDAELKVMSSTDTLDDRETDLIHLHTSVIAAIRESEKRSGIGGKFGDPSLPQVRLRRPTEYRDSEFAGVMQDDAAPTCSALRR